MNLWNFAACPVCKTLAPRPRILCHLCREGLWRHREPFRREEDGFAVHSLFAWRDGGPQAFDWLLRSLKSQEHPAYWSEFASWMVPLSNARLPRPFCLVPVPSRRPHALGFARGVAQWTGMEIVQNLELPATRRWQKGLSRQERQRVQFQSSGALCTQYKAVLIIDDVVTTGATLRAAYHALGRPRNCEAWCLMDRRPCGGSKPLL